MADSNYDYSDYTCGRCGPIQNEQVNTIVSVDHVPYGDQSIPMYSYEYSCNHCGCEVEYDG
jgi:hypothetical protein